MIRVAVIDYGMGNLHSASKALEHVAGGQASICVTHDADIIRESDKVVLPGVGAIRDCMAEIKRLEIDALVKEVVQEKPLLGICVGMQALLARSCENDGVDCIGLLPGQVNYFNDQQPVVSQHLKVPHMGWNQVTWDSQHPMWHGLESSSRFYFVHSYFVPADHENTVGRVDYGVPAAAALSTSNVFAVQFHPEKSHAAGLQLLKNFIHWDGSAC